MAEEAKAVLEGAGWGDGDGFEGGWGRVDDDERIGGDEAGVGEGICGAGWDHGGGFGGLGFSV